MLNSALSSKECQTINDGEHYDRVDKNWIDSKWILEETLVRNIGDDDDDDVVTETHQVINRNLTKKT